MNGRQVQDSDASHYLYVYFGRIRKKVGDRYADLIETVPGIGYLLLRPI